MRVKVGDKIYDGLKEPIMVILSDKDKENISQMRPEDKKYCSYPPSEEWTKDDHANILAWMEDL